MRIFIHLLSALSVIPIIAVLLFFAVVGLMGYFIATFVCGSLTIGLMWSAFYFRPTTNSILSLGQIVHLIFVACSCFAIIFFIGESSYYKPLFWVFSGVPLLIAAPFIHFLLQRKKQRTLKHL